MAERLPREAVSASTFAALVVTITFWASAFAGIREALHGYSPFHLVVFRYALTSAVLAGFAVPARVRLPRLRDVPALLALGFIGVTVYATTISIGEQTVTAGVASLIVASETIFIAILATSFLGERLTVWGWLGTLIGFAGVAVIMLSQGGTAWELDVHALWPLASAISTSLYFVFQKPLFARYTAYEINAYCLWFGTLFMLPFVGGLPREMAAASWRPTVAVIFLGIFPGAVAYSTWTYALSRAPASIVSNVLFLVPPLAIVVALVWLDELPTFMSLVGGAVTLAGVVLVGLKGYGGLARGLPGARSKNDAGETGAG